MSILSLTTQNASATHKENGKKFRLICLGSNNTSPKSTSALRWRTPRASIPLHLNKNQQVVDHFENLRLGNRSWLEDHWDWAKLKDHGFLSDTYYFAGAPERRKPHTMFLLDVDCKRRGTPEGAQAYLAYIASDEWPGVRSVFSRPIH